MARLQRREWILIGGLFVSMFFILAANDTFGIFLTPLVDSFGWSHAQVSLLFTCESLALGLSATIVGWLLDRINARWLFGFGALLSGFCYLAASRVDSFIAMLIIFIIIGAGLASTTFLALSVVVSNWFDEERGLVMGIAMSGEMFGAMILALVVSSIIERAGWRMGFVAIALPMILIVAPLSFAVIRTHRPGRKTAQSGDEETAPGFEVREAIATRSFWMLAIAYLCWGYSFGAPFTQLVTYLIGLGYRPASAALAFSMMMGFAIVGELAFGRAADRLGARPVAAAIFTITAIIQIVLLGAANVASLVIFVIVNGLVIESAMVVLPIVLADSLGLRRFGSLNGLMWFPLCVGVALGPVVSGKFFDVSGSYAHAFELSAAIAIIGAVTAFATIPGNFAAHGEELAGGLRA